MFIVARIPIGCFNHTLPKVRGERLFDIAAVTLDVGVEIATLVLPSFEFAQQWEIDVLLPMVRPGEINEAGKERDDIEADHGAERNGEPRSLMRERTNHRARTSAPWRVSR